MIVSGGGVLDSDVVLASDIGNLKALTLCNGKLQTLPFSYDEKKEDITSVIWDKNEQNSILLSLRSKGAYRYNLVTSSYEKLYQSDDIGSIVGIQWHNSHLVVVHSSGKIRVIKEKEVQAEFGRGEHYACVASHASLVAVGGKNTDLQVWNLDQTGPNSSPLFMGKNLRNDKLDLQVPIWVNCVAFHPPGNGQLVFTGTGYNQVRLYDLRSGSQQQRRRRPVVSINWQNGPVTRISPANPDDSGSDQWQVVVGNTLGDLALLDLRQTQVPVVRAYQGCGAAIRGIYCELASSSSAAVHSCSADRFYRVHDKETGKLVCKVFLKSRPTCLLVKDNVRACSQLPDDYDRVNQKQQPTPDDDDEVWDKLEPTRILVRKRKVEDSDSDGQSSSSASDDD